MAKPSDLPEINTNETRTTALTTEIKDDGWPYAATEDQYERFSGNLRNWLDNNIYKWIKSINDLGILGYDSGTDYIISAVATGSDGLVYQAKIANGPTTSIVDPVGDSTGSWIVLNSDKWAQNNLFHTQEKTSSGVGAGDFNSGAWRTRNLDTEVTTDISGASLSSAQLTLPAGTYYIDASAPAFKVNQHRAKLYNITLASDIMLGTSTISESMSDQTDSRSHVSGNFTLNTTTIIELQHQCTTTKATNGLGIAGSFGEEIYTDCKIWKIG